MEELRDVEDAVAPFPAQQRLTMPLRNDASQPGIGDFLALLSGQAARLCRALPAGELVATLASETEAALQRARAGP